jgi:hypothetical protein
MDFKYLQFNSWSLLSIIGLIYRSSNSLGLFCLLCHTSIKGKVTLIIQHQLHQLVLACTQIHNNVGKPTFIALSKWHSGCSCIQVRIVPNRSCTVIGGVRSSWSQVGTVISCAGMSQSLVGMGWWTMNGWM